MLTAGVRPTLCSVWRPPGGRVVEQPGPSRRQPGIGPRRHSTSAPLLTWTTADERPWSWTPSPAPPDHSTSQASKAPVTRRRTARRPPGRRPGGSRRWRSGTTTSPPAMSCIDPNGSGRPGCLLVASSPWTSVISAPASPSPTAADLPGAVGGVPAPGRFLPSAAPATLAWPPDGTGRHGGVGAPPFRSVDSGVGPRPPAAI